MKACISALVALAALAPRGGNEERRLFEYLEDFEEPPPKDAVYEMIEMDVGSIHPPAPIYRGYGVFKILEIRRANEAEFPQRRASYEEQIRTKERYEGFHAWLSALREQARISAYAKPPDGIFQGASP
jgi:hypothetical protein